MSLPETEQEILTVHHTMAFALPYEIVISMECRGCGEAFVLLGALFPEGMQVRCTVCEEERHMMTLETAMETWAGA